MRDIRVRLWNNDTIPKSVIFTHENGEEWIGLQDKNGVDVYEGDIILCEQGCPHTVGLIKEHGGVFVGGMPTFYLSELGTGYAWTGKEEIIGNIHQ